MTNGGLRSDYEPTKDTTYHNLKLSYGVSFEGLFHLEKNDYCQTSNISCSFVHNEIVDHSDVVGASPVSAAPTTSSYLT